MLKQYGKIHTHTKKNMSDFDNNSNDFDDNSNEKENLEYSGVYSVTLRIHVHQDPQKTSLFGNMFYVDVIIVRMKRRNHTGLVIGQNLMTVFFLIRNRKDTETQGRKLYEDEGKDQSDKIINQGMPRILCNHQKKGERPGKVSPSNPTKPKACDWQICNILREQKYGRGNQPC